MSWRSRLRRAYTVKTATVMFVSAAVMLSTNSLPSPGMPKMVSMMTLPVMMLNDQRPEDADHRMSACAAHGGR